jgi:hypothetical protein
MWVDLMRDLAMSFPRRVTAEVSSEVMLVAVEVCGVRLLFPIAITTNNNMRLSNRRVGLSSHNVRW